MNKHLSLTKFDSIKKKWSVKQTQKKINLNTAKKFNSIISFGYRHIIDKDIIDNLKYPIINLSQSQKRGYSPAVIDGIYSSSKKFILCTDSDNQIKVKSLIENLNNFPEINEFLVGFRNPRKDPLHRLIYSKIFKILHSLLFNSKLKDPSCPFVIGLKATFEKLDRKKLLYMKEGFWWGFIGHCTKNNIKFKEIPIDHFRREAGEAGFKLKHLIGIIVRNIIGLVKIKIG